MSGYAERGYNKFIAGQIDLFYSIIKEEILPTLPAKYSFDMVYNFLTQYYCILLVDTPNSRSSIWVAYELKYAKNIGKPIYSVSIDMPLTLSGIKELKDEWYKQINTDNLIY